MPAIVKRGNATSIHDFERPEIINTDHPYQFNFKNAKEMIMDAINNHERITVVGDYDADGVCATAILGLTLNSLGADFKLRIPYRFTEGYGMKPSMIDEIPSGLVITVDNGIAAHDAVKAAKEKGLKVLLTDHHLPTVNNGELDLPDADCIINPHVEEVAGKSGYDFADYCGAGIALKVSEEVLGKDHPLMNRMYALASIATVADVVPLVEDNRNIYIRGTKAITEGDITAGLKALFDLNNISTDVPNGLYPHTALSGDIMGFRIGPCINAASRMNDKGAYAALKCLICNKDVNTATMLAKALIDTNESRKDLTAKEGMVIDKYLQETGILCPLIVHMPESGPGIIGLHAGRLCEEYKVPVIVLNGSGDVCHGSARAPEGVHMKNMLDSVSDLLVGYGGHAGAAGLTIEEENIPEFTRRLKEYCVEHDIEPNTDDTQYFDLEIDGDEIPLMAETLQKLAPFGEGNPAPVFAVHYTIDEKPALLGGKHLKLNSGDYSAIGFGLGENIDELSECDSVLCVGTIGYNAFRGNVTPQMNMTYIEEDHVLSKEDMERG